MNPARFFLALLVFAAGWPPLSIAASAAAPASGEGGDGGPRWRLVLKLTGLASHGDAGVISDTQEQGFRAQAMGAPLGWLDYQIDYVQVFQGRDPAAAAAGSGGAALYRYRSWRRYLAGEDLTQRGVWYHELDRAFARVKTGAVETVLGRFPLAWGAGRIWRPTDLFAAFSPLTLDTEFKAGVDGLRLNLFPGNFSALTVAYLLSPAAEPETDDSLALHYRTTLGEVSEMTLVAGTVRGKEVYGGSFETAFWDAGWVGEALSYQPNQGAEAQTFAVVGTNGSFGGETTFLAEWYFNSLGARSEADLAALAADPIAAIAIGEGRMPHLSRNVLGLGLQTSFGGLWGGGYNLLVSALRDSEGGTGYSHLHQAVLSYSVADEAEAVVALALPNGGAASEFGALPGSLVFSIKFVL